MKQIFKLCSIVGLVILIATVGLLFLGPIILMRNVVKSGDSSSMFTFMHYVGSYSGILIPLGIVLILVGMFGKTSVGNKILKNGVSTLGKIVSARETGALMNNHPQIEFSIEFLLSNGNKIKSNVKKVVSLVNLSQFQKGMVILVKYDQNNPENMAVDWKASYDDLQKAQKRIQYYPGFTEMGFKI